jgi:hypothetical protein
MQSNMTVIKQSADEVIRLAKEVLTALSGHVFDVLTIHKPISPEAALNFAKVVSKLSPLLGNLIEINTVEMLNDRPEFGPLGKWKRQDPGFPDVILDGPIQPQPGFEVKAWFPLATEITGRFKDSQNRFSGSGSNVYVCMPAWLPEHLVYGRPYILDVVVVPGASVAKARDDHYHNPPDYLVVEPGDTTKRTRNLQQTNTSGYKFQGSETELEQAAKVVETWGLDGRVYKPTREYQELIRALMGRFNKYRLDTNYAKMDRVAHTELEAFKTKMNHTVVNGMTVSAWSKLFASIKPDDKKNPAVLQRNEAALRDALATHLQIREEDAEKLLV